MSKKRVDLEKDYDLAKWHTILIKYVLPCMNHILSLLPLSFILRLKGIVFIRLAVSNALSIKMIKKNYWKSHPGKIIDTKNLLPENFIFNNEKNNFSSYIKKGKNEIFVGQKVAIMAHFDPHGKIDPYVIEYLKHLQIMNYKLILAGCDGLNENLDILSAIVLRSGLGYDFTNWQCAFREFPTLFEAEEILLCNDSVFAPISPLEPIHKLMHKLPCDFWGLCESRQIIPHLQSYYLVFKKKAISHAAFKRFWSEITVKNRKEALQAELNLTTWLTSNNLTAGAYISCDLLPDIEMSPLHFFWRPLIELYDFPCIKRDLLAGDVKVVDTSALRSVLVEKNYDLMLVDNYFMRIKSLIQ